MSYNTAGLSIQQYKLVQQYLSIDKITLLKNKDANVHELIYSEEFASSLFKGGVLKYKGLRQHFLDQVPIPKKKSYWDKLKEDPTCILKKNAVINFHSKVGQGAATALTHLGKGLIDAGVGIEIVNGFDFNRLIVDFDDGYDAASLTKKDALLFFYWNGVHRTDYKKQALQDILLSTMDRNIPLIISSHQAMPEFFNIEFDDGVSSTAALLKAAYGEL